MASIELEPLKEVLSNYNIKVLKITNECYKDKKGVWWIETPNGSKVLKKMSSSEQTLKFIISAANYLTENGVLIPKVIKTKDNHNYVNFNGTRYVLSEAVYGKTPDYNSAKELEYIVEGMANFHKASVGFVCPDDCKPKNHFGLWIEEYTNAIEDMNKFYKSELENKSSKPISKFMANEFPYFYERAEKAIQGLKKDEYKNWSDKISKSGGLCHQDFASGNLILSSSKLYVLDTDSITFDIPARDIRKLINKIVKKTGKWNSELLFKIMSYYQKVNPLTTSEWQIVKYDLMFPHLFLGAINKYYYQRDKKWSEEDYIKKIKATTIFEKTIAPILNSFDAMALKVTKQN